MARVTATAWLALFAILPAHAQAPAVNVPGRGQQVQPMPPPLLQPGQFLTTTPPAMDTTTPSLGPATPGTAPIAPVQNEWVSQSTAELRAIDKVMARTTTLTAKVGETVRFGPLSVLVRDCVIRPPDRAQDAAVFLEISAPGRPSVFRGWMLLSLPQLALVEHPTHDVRLAACRP